MIELSLAPGELAELNSHLAPRSFQELVQRWKSFVESLDGYAFTIYDYDNDVAVRDQIAAATAKCSIAVQVKVWAVLSDLDQRYLEATVDVDRSRSPVGSWNRRLPRNPGGELGRDIEDGNL